MAERTATPAAPVEGEATVAVPSEQAVPGPAPAEQATRIEAVVPVAAVDAEATRMEAVPPVQRAAREATRIEYAPPVLPIEGDATRVEAAPPVSPIDAEATRVQAAPPVVVDAATRAEVGPPAIPAEATRAEAAPSVVVDRDATRLQAAPLAVETTRPLRSGSVARAVHLEPTRPLARPARDDRTETSPLMPARARMQAQPQAPQHARTFWQRAEELVAPYAVLAIAAAPLVAYYWVTLAAPGSRLIWGRPAMLALLAALPPLAAFGFHLPRRRLPAMMFSRTVNVRATAQGLARHLMHLPCALRMVVVALVVIALARPQHEGADITEVEGIDIVIALDVSNSMSDQDLPPDRLSAAKEVLRRFIGKRKSDRIGLVIFGRDAFTQCPLTLDYRALSGLLAEVRLGLVDGRGTAIGNAIATALNRLRRSDAKSKVIILLTDGDNNAGNVAPQQAAKYAQSLGVKVFTILMGGDVAHAVPGNPFFRTPPRYPVNPKLLEEIAGETGGTPYLATDQNALEQRFQAILDELDRSRIKDQKSKPKELYARFAWPALGLLLLEFVLALTRYRRFP